MNKLLTALAMLFVLGISFGSQAADFRKRQAVQPQYAVEPTPPLKRIPIVGTVVYGGLDYAGKLILSPTELVTGPRR